MLFRGRREVIEIVERVRRVSPQLVSCTVVLPVAMEVGSPASLAYAQEVAGMVSTTPPTLLSPATTHVEVVEGGLLHHLCPLLLHFRR
jgi:hypothetical protein